MIRYRLPAASRRRYSRNWPHQKAAASWEILGGQAWLSYNGPGYIEFSLTDGGLDIALYGASGPLATGTAFYGFSVMYPLIGTTG